MEEKKDFSDNLSKIDGKQLGEQIKGVAKGDAKSVCDLALNIGGIAGMFCPELGIAVQCVKIMYDLISALLQNDKIKMSEENKMLALLARAFSSDNLSKSRGKLKSMVTDIQTSMETLNKKFNINNNIKYDEEIIDELVKFNTVTKQQIMNAMNKIKNPKDINEIDEYLQSDKSEEQREMNRHKKKLFDQYSKLKAIMLGEFESIARNIQKQQHLTENYILITETSDEIVQFIQLLQFMNIIFGVIAKIVGNDINYKDVDNVIFETENEILEWTKITTTGLLNELEFLVKPTFSNRFIVAMFYWSKHSEFMIPFIEAMTDFKFINNTDFPKNGFFLYPLKWKQKPCYINLKKDKKTIYYTYDKDIQHSVIYQKQVRRGVYELYFNVDEEKRYWIHGDDIVMSIKWCGFDFVMFKIDEKAWVIFVGSKKNHKFVYFSSPAFDECRLRFSDIEGEKAQFVMEDTTMFRAIKMIFAQFASK